jgi:hypothetical protein
MKSMALPSTSRVKTSTINRYIRQEIAPIYRKSFIMAMLKARGRIKYNMGGDEIVWYPRYKRRTIRNIAGPVTATSFPATNTKIKASLGWAGYDLGESIEKLERLKNQGSEVKLFDIAQSTIKELIEDFTEDLRLKLWDDGATTDGLMGIGSWSAYADTDATPCVKTSTNGEFWSVAPTATYARLSCALGAKVDDWTAPDGSAWPVGTGATGYHFWSPLLVDYNSALFTPTSGSTHNWDTQWQQALNALTTYSGILQKNPLDVIVLDPDLLRRAKDSTIGNQRFVVTDGTEVRSLGFKSLEWEGVELMEEYGVPAGRGYGLRFDKLNLWSMQGQLIERTEDTSIVTSEDLYKLDSYLQLWTESPAYHGALVPGVTAA